MSSYWSGLQFSAILQSVTLRAAIRTMIIVILSLAAGILLFRIGLEKAAGASDTGHTGKSDF